jgi:hypothetical protein
LFIALFFTHSSPALAQSAPPQDTPKPAYKISGLVFGDYYAFPAHHLEKWEGQHGWWFRRAYFTYDHTFTPVLTSRLRLEMNGNGKLAGGALTPYVKDAYLRWTPMGKQAITIGMQPSLTFDFLESVWGLRHIEKTPLDLYRWDSSRDTGISLAGPINASQSLKYAVQYGNESGSNAEADELKGYRASLRYDTNPGFSLEGLFAHFNRADNADRVTAQVFAAYRGARGRAGAQYSFQRRRSAARSPETDTDMRVASVFGVVDLQPKKTSAFGRIDRHVDPCTDCAAVDYLPMDSSAPFTLVMAGVDHAIHPSIRFSPNVQWVSYSRPDATTQAPAADLAVRLTFYWSF